MLFWLISWSLPAQKGDQVPVKKNRFCLYGGVGPNYYFNNLVIAKNFVHPWNYSLTARLMWEPEHFISLGFESGYYQLYTVTYKPPSSRWPAEVTNIAVPLQLVVSMKFLMSYYADLSIGQSNLITRFSNPEMGRFEASSWSLADFGITGGYKHFIGNRVSVGAETKFFHSTKNKDNNLALVVIAAFHF